MSGRAEHLQLGTQMMMRGICMLLAVLLVKTSAAQIEVAVHRGANHLAPENTKAAAQAAIDLGADYVEVDVRTSRDGELFIMHDLTVNRTTDGSGFIASKNSEEIMKLDAGSWFGPEFKGEPVPRLRDYLKWIKGKTKVYFDVKDAHIEQLVRMVRQHGMEEDCFFWSGKKKWLREFRAVAPELPLKVNARNISQLEEVMEKYNPQIVECGLSDVTPEFVSACREKGVKIMLYGGKETEEYFRKVIATDGVDMVNIDCPALYFKVLREGEE